MGGRAGGGGVDCRREWGGGEGGCIAWRRERGNSEQHCVHPKTLSSQVRMHSDPNEANEARYESETDSGSGLPATTTTTHRAAVAGEAAHAAQTALNATMLERTRRAPLLALSSSSSLRHFHPSPTHGHSQIRARTTAIRSLTFSDSCRSALPARRPPMGSPLQRPHALVPRFPRHEFLPATSRAPALDYPA